MLFRSECAARAGKKWTGNEPENFALMGLIPEDDPGLVILQIHRLVHDEALPERFLERLGALPVATVHAGHFASFGRERLAVLIGQYLAGKRRPGCPI